MNSASRTRDAAVLAVGLVAGLALLRWLLGSSLIRFKEFDRTVTVKGLAELGRLGKIKQAQQGIFSISDRDANTPYIKKVRVVSTIEYYLAD